MERTAIVVGAGIGGLAAAGVLRRAGWTVRIYERADSARELGFGLGLAPNALSALRELGVADSIVRAGATLGPIELRFPNGRLLRHFDLRVGLPAVVALRPDLYGALIATAGDELHLDREAASFDQGARAITVCFKDGHTDTGALLIGADGIHSSIRRQLHPSEPPPRPSGFVAVRGVAYGVADQLGSLSGIGYFGDGIEAAAMRASSEDAVYWYMSLRAQDVVSDSAEIVANERCREFESSFRAIVVGTAPERMRLDHLVKRDPLARWGTGRVTLIGDAAHPVLPHTGQGAAQALEDAVALGLALTNSRDIQQALRRYEAVRSKRTREFVRLGPRIARVTTTRNVAIKGLRSWAIQVLPMALLKLGASATFASDPHAPLRRVA